MKTIKLLSTSLFLTACLLLNSHIASAQQNQETTLSVGSDDSPFVGLNSLELNEMSNRGVFLLASNGTLTCHISSWVMRPSHDSMVIDPVPPQFTLTSDNLTLIKTSFYDHGLDTEAWEFTFQATSTTGENILHFTKSDGNEIFFMVIVR